MSDVDNQIMKFLNMLEGEKDKPAPIPTNLRVSTRSAICKITKDINVNKMVEILAYNIKNKSDYPILTIKYRDTNVSSIIPKKKKTCKKEKKSFFNQITLLIKPHDTIRPQNIKLFKNSSMSMTGGKQHYDGLCAVVVLLNEIKKYPAIFKSDESRKNITYDDFRITLINSDFSINYTIDRMLLYELLVKEYNMFVVYSPDIYSGVKIYFFWNENKKYQDGICDCGNKCYNKKNKYKVVGDCKKITIAVFQSGNIIITGANDIKQTKDAYKHITMVTKMHYNHLKRFTIHDCDKDMLNISNNSSIKKSKSPEVTNKCYLTKKINIKITKK